MDAIQKSRNLTDTRKSLKHITEGLNIIDVNVRGNAARMSCHSHSVFIKLCTLYNLCYYLLYRKMY